MASDIRQLIGRRGVSASAKLNQILVAIRRQGGGE